MQKRPLQILWLFVSCLLCAAAAMAAGTLKIEEQVAMLGEDAGDPIVTGFVFVDGMYVDSPYRVSRRGLAVCINGHAIVPPVLEWPPPDLDVPDPPGIPEGLTEDSGFANIEKSPTESGHDAPLYKAMRYCDQHFSDEEAVQKKIEWFESLPFVASVKRLSSKRVEIRTKRGAVRRGWVGRSGGPPGVSATPTKERAIGVANGQRSWYEKILRDDKCLIKLRKGGHIIVKADVARAELPRIAETLQSNRSRDEKIAFLKGLEAMGTSWKDATEAIVDTFSVTPQLQQRLRETEENAARQD